MVEKLKAQGKNKHKITITNARPACKDVWEDLNCNHQYWRRKNTEFFVTDLSADQVQYKKVSSHFAFHQKKIVNYI